MTHSLEIILIYFIINDGIESLLNQIDIYTKKYVNTDRKR